MINFYNQVPSIYPSASRDFQYISWLINIVLNSVKHNVDDLYDLPHAEISPKISELLALTLGFKVKRNYDQKQLAALVAILPSILRYKGTIKAIEMAAEALITASGSLGDTECKVEGNQLTVVLPKDLIDTTLFLDLLDYILPAGMLCRIVRKTQTRRYLDDIKVVYSDYLYSDIYDDLSWDSATKLSFGLSGLVDIEKITPETFTSANFRITRDEHGNKVLTLNAGLLDNTVIPVIATVGQVDDEFDDGIGLYSTEINGYNYLLYSTEPNGTNLKLIAYDSVHKQA